MRNLIACVALLIGGITQFPAKGPERTDPANSATTLVQSPFDGWSNATETVQFPQPDPIPNQLGSPETDRLRELAEQLTKDASEISKRAEELKPKLSAEYWEAGAECKCDCESLDEATLRKIINEEVTAVIVSQPRLASSTSNGSAGGTTSPFALHTSSSASSPPPFGSSGSAGGSVSTATSYGTSSTERPRLGQRVADRLRSPLRANSTSKVTIHTFASGQYCGACENWLATVAPRLQAEGVIVTQIADVTSGAAPQIDVCKDNTSCVRLDGAASYSQIVGLLR